MTALALVAPLSGWLLPLSEVPDAVFAGGLAGDGVAIDPTTDALVAPCDGVVVLAPNMRHALSVRSALGAEILLHVGIDTVALAGEGFTLSVADGARVRAGQTLLRFDLDRVARRAKSVITPIVLAGSGQIQRRAAPGPITTGDFLLEVAITQSAESPVQATVKERRRFIVPFDHGLHARPAALVVSALKAHTADVIVRAHGRQADARSTVALMSLAVRAGDEVEVEATGKDAGAALAALETLLAPTPTPVPTPTPTSTAVRGTVATPPDEPSAAAVPGRLTAVVAAPGLAVGVAAPLTPVEIEVAEPGNGVAVERAALERARAAVLAHLTATLAGAAGERRAILEAHRELLQDPALTAAALADLERGKSAGFAWRAAVRTAADALAQLEDARLRERAADLRDLEAPLLRVLRGQAAALDGQLPEQAILLGDEILPSQLISADATRVAGLCMARGGPTSHVAILAAAMGIPALVAAGPAVLGIRAGTPLVVDGLQGVLEVAPPEDRLVAERQRIAARTAAARTAVATAAGPAITTDGVRIGVLANVNNAAEAAAAVRLGAEGCGLLRTEFLFLDRRTPPSLEEQQTSYGEVLAALGGRPLTIRTLDVGGDKPIAYLPLPHEDNPALGLRGVRASLIRPELLRVQLEAILRTAQQGPCRILVPMVTDVAELRTVRTLFNTIPGASASGPPIGVMIETPASALLADALVAEADFLSIGTNDLTQYTLAMDRTQPELARYCDALHPAILRLIGGAAAAAAGRGRTLSVCGGVASDPAAVPVLIGLGVRELSAIPSVIPGIKARVRVLSIEACRALAHEAQRLESASAVRARLARWHSESGLVPEDAT